MNDLSHCMAALKHAGVTTVNQARLLAALVDGGMSMTLMAEALGVTTAAITGMADALEHAGLVRREQGGDRRKLVLVLTEAGAALVREAWGGSAVAAEAAAVRRELLLGVEYLRAACEHAEGRAAVDRQWLTRATGLGIRLLAKHKAALDDFQQAQYWEELAGLPVRFGLAPVAPEGEGRATA